MTWLWVILIVALIGGLIGYFDSGTKEGALEGAVVAGLGCGYVIFRIFLALLGLYILFLIGSWLFS